MKPFEGTWLIHMGDVWQGGGLLIYTDYFTRVPWHQAVDALDLTQLGGRFLQPQKPFQNQKLDIHSFQLREK